MSRPYSSFTGKRKPLAPFSAKRLAEHDKRQEISDAVKERDNDRCRAIGLIPGHQCSGGRHAHEIDKRSRKPGSHLWDNLDGYLWLCDGANGWVEDWPIEAQALGLSRWSWEHGE